MDFGDRSDNPFSVSLTMGKTPGRRNFRSSIRFFVLVCLCLAVALVVTTQGQRWLVSRLTHDFDSLTAPEKRQRLVQLAELGPAGVPPLVGALAEPDLEVGRTAYELLQQAQNNWTVLQENERVERHAALVRALEDVAVDLPEDRTGWGTSLLQQTLLVAVDRQSETSRQLYQQANHALDLFSLTSRMGVVPADPIESEEGPLRDRDDSRQPTRLSIRAEPLPVDQAQSAELWTQWPPPNEMRYASEAIAKESPVHQKASLTSSVAVADPPSATVYRSGGKLQPVAQGDGVDLDEPPTRGGAPLRPGSEESESESAEVAAAALEMEAPLETYDDPSVMHWLGSDHRRLRQAAEAELFRRGYDAAEIDLARQLVTGDVSTRIQLIDFIAQSSTLDPRRWLPVLLEDPSRDVKLRAISVLATMDDPAVAQRLQMHLSNEQDPTVAARIRRVLKLR